VNLAEAVEASGKLPAKGDYEFVRIDGDELIHMAICVAVMNKPDSDGMYTIHYTLRCGIVLASIDMERVIVAERHETATCMRCVL
jgi:hypothetical protein